MMKFNLVTLSLMLSLFFCVSCQEIAPPVDEEPDLSRAPPCQPCGKWVNVWSTSCTTSNQKSVKIVPAWLGYANCNAPPTCQNFWCPSGMVRKCVPVFYSTSTQVLLNSNPAKKVTCYLPKICLCKCEWPVPIVVGPVEENVDKV